MAKATTDEECCQRTRARWLRRIALYYATFPVIRNVPCDGCRRILEIRVFQKPAA